MNYYASKNLKTGFGTSIKDAPIIYNIPLTPNNLFEFSDILLNPPL